MKKLTLLLVLVACFILPISVFANVEPKNDEKEKENGETLEVDKRVTVYFFRGDGCPNCAKAEDFFKSIQSSYGSKFKIADYETWDNDENAELLKKIGKARNEEIKGVPYILIGNKSFLGYSSDFDDSIKKAIDEEYAKNPSDRYDIMNYLPKEEKKKGGISGKELVGLLAMLGITGGAIYGVSSAKKKAN